MNADLTTNLETILSELLAAHEDLLDLTREQRRALSQADSAALEACTRRQHETFARINTLDEERRRIARMLTGDHGKVQVSRIAAALPEPARGRISGLAARLREVLTLLQEQHRILRAAAGALAGHMDGLMQQVAAAISQAGGMGPGTYGRQGRIQSAPAACALDMQH